MWFKASIHPKGYGVTPLCLNMEIDRETFDKLKEAFSPVIRDRKLLGDTNPNFSKAFGFEFPNHPQFTLKLENGDEITIWTQHRDV
jgi:hypothetical protein